LKLVYIWMSSTESLASTSLLTTTSVKYKHHLCMSSLKHKKLSN